MATSVPELLRKKRDGEELTATEIRSFADGIRAGRVAESQIGAMLMAMYIRGLTDEETTALTRALFETGEQLKWDPLWSLVDKHSTGGVGDKVSIPLAPALAALGLKVPMFSGRGLEFTGGTLDKLESIPGFKVECSFDELKKTLTTAGCFIAGTSSLVPVDKILYSIRDVTSTVDSIPLTVASIVSKKFAEGAKVLVMDIKIGRAAFFKTVEDAKQLAQKMIEVSGKLGIRTRVAITQMDYPLGKCIGNALEIEESVACMKGQGPSDLVEVTAVAGALILLTKNMAKSLEEGKAAICEVLSNGKALECFKKMLLGQGVAEETAKELCYGDIWKVLPSVPKTQITCVKTKKSGTIVCIDALEIGIAVWKLGAGRSLPGQEIDYRVGVRLLKVVGEMVNEGDIWIEVHHASKSLSSDIQEHIEGALKIEMKSFTPASRIIEIM